MFQYLKNIQTVAKFEAKLLVRSWFFKVFTVIVGFIFCIFTYIVFFQEGSGLSVLSLMPSLFPYFVLLMLNVVQSIVSIFLASEYLKRDKQLDTSEVFYVRPLSNAEYLLGKMWGTLRVFFIFDLILLGAACVCSLLKTNVAVDYSSYIIYFMLIAVPTLVFIVGLSTAVMLLIRNQALTFVIVLGYVGLTLKYIQSYYYYLFDYIGFSIPMTRSTIVGFADVEMLFNHRVMYVMLGIACVCFSVFRFGRLPNSKKRNYISLAVAFFFLLLGAGAGFNHVEQYLKKNGIQKRSIELNNIHVNDPKMVIDSCYLDVVQDEAQLQVESKMWAIPIETAKRFTFALNRGFVVSEVKDHSGNGLLYERNEHLLLVDFGRTITPQDTVFFDVVYKGIADERTCYLDIAEEKMMEIYEFQDLPFINIGQRYLFQNKDYVLLTPESNWYPRPGVTYSDKSPDWQQNYFTNYHVRVKPNSGLVPIIQGDCAIESDSLTYSFAAEYPLQSLTLAIGRFMNKSITVDSTEYSLHLLEGHDYFTASFDTIRDTVPAIIREKRLQYESKVNMQYPFKRFTIVEAPVLLKSFPRAWTQAQEVVQPEIVLFPEFGSQSWSLNFEEQLRWRDRAIKMGWDKSATAYTIRMDILKNAMDIMYWQSKTSNFSEGKMGRMDVTSVENPYYFFPLMYNFRYNIYSAHWPVANRLVETVLLGEKGGDNSWIRQYNGLSDAEKAILKLQENSFKKLLSDVEYSNLIPSYIALEASELFAAARLKMGIKALNDSLVTIVKSSDFINLPFDTLLAKLERVSGVEIRSQMNAWEITNKIPEYMFGEPRLSKIDLMDKEIFQSEQVISNPSDVGGYIDYSYMFANSWGDKTLLGPNMKPRRFLLYLEPNQTIRLVRHWEGEAPIMFYINTLIAKNIPSEVSFTAPTPIDSRNLLPEGEEEISSDYLIEKGEIIVDNEDEGFELSKAPPSGFLNHWIDKSMQNSFKYVGIMSWRPPMRWTATTDNRYYGKLIRSAYAIRAGDGTQTATWRIPITKHGRYELYYYLRRPDELDWQGDNDKKDFYYYLEVGYGDFSEKIELKIKKNSNGWVYLGKYDVDADQVKVVVSNKTQNIRVVFADAVKMVNVDETGSQRKRNNDH